MLRKSAFFNFACLLLLCANGCQNDTGMSQTEQPVSDQLMSKWALDVDPENVWQIYPRPGLVREKWKNLNGLWEYAITQKDDIVPDKYDGSILVPFPIESALSGVQKSVSSEQRLWYNRTFNVPDDWQGQNILLHFEAIDWEARVWVNDVEVGEHRGGYDPFSFDITSALKSGENYIVVKVFDPTDDGTQPIGKQTKTPQGIYYTPSTGIWQTVWLEPVPKTFIQEVKINPEIDNKEVKINALLNTPLNAQRNIKAEVFLENEQITQAFFKPNQPFALKIQNPTLWSPESPQLYDLKLTLELDGEPVDIVRSYFGMRKIALAKDTDGFTKIFLNNAFVFQNGPLDQGFWPGGLYTPPSPEAMKYDLEVTKSLGFNMLRKHVKIEPRSFYHMCDKLGILVWQDMPNGDKKISPSEPDIVRSKASAEQFEYELSEMIRHLYNHPSIVMWVPFNEGWGQYETENVVNFVKSLDPTRLVNNASGWSDRGVGDVLDLHNYPEPISPNPESERAIVLGEFGGLGLPIKDHLWNADHWGYQNLNTKEDLMLKYEQFYDQIWAFKESTGLSASVYTQITDVEGEVNGLLTYDRAILKVNAEEMRKVNSNQYLSGPRFKPEGGLFNAGESVEIYSSQDSEIRYTTDEKEPTSSDEKYSGPIELKNSMVIKAKAFSDKTESRTVHASYQLTQMKRPIYTHAYSEKYRAGGDFGLIDGDVGTEAYADGKWQGFEGNDLEVIIDLGQVKSVDSISLNFLEDTKAWIFHPAEVKISASPDGKKYDQQFHASFTTPTAHTEKQIKRIQSATKNQPIQFIRIQAKNVGTCPVWHDGTGGKAWIFIDEVSIK
jgi:hypothetical protein